MQKLMQVLCGFEPFPPRMAVSALVDSGFCHIIYLALKNTTIARNDIFGLEHLSSSSPSLPCHIPVEGEMRQAK